MDEYDQGPAAAGRVLSVLSHRPWETLGPILHHGQVPGHNQPSEPGYEWGLEGAQLVVGHATATIHNGELSLLFQERRPLGAWRYGLASAPVRAAVGGRGAA